MWLRTSARWRKSPRLESWPVVVQLTQTKHVTPAPVGGPAAEGLYTDVQSLSLPWTQYCVKQIGSHWQSSVTGSSGTGTTRRIWVTDDSRGSSILVNTLLLRH